jgi:hypothetical protein
LSGLILFSLEKPVAITTTTGRNNGFLALCGKDESFPNVLSYHCIIHQEALCAKVLKFDHVMNVVTKTKKKLNSMA